jgi:hypothetical protein
MNWRLQRQIIIFFTYFLIVFIPFSFITYKLLQKPASCYDGLLNSDETGVDCGGSCQLRCDGTYKDLKINFARAMKVTDNVYDIFVLVENFNDKVEFPVVPYNLGFYNEQGEALGSSTGTLTIAPQAKGVVYLPNVNIKQLPKVVDFKLGKYAGVANYFNDTPVKIQVGAWVSQRGANDTLQVVGELENPYSKEYFDLEVYALLYDETKTVYAVGKTEVRKIGGREKTAVAYTWGNIQKPQNVEFVILQK